MFLLYIIQVKKRYTFDIKVIDNENFSVRRFKETKLNPKQRTKTVLILQTNKRLFLSDSKNTALKIKIKAFAKEDSKISIEKEVSFIYPRNDLIK